MFREFLVFSNSMKKLASILLFLFLSFNLTAQQPVNSSSEILLQLQKINTVGSVLYIAAHPDDENTRLLTWLSKEKKVRTGYLSITRGDGGQNLIGKEQGEPLGVIRTQELLAARRIDGAEQFFTRAYDFGYSKNPEETFRFWNKELILADMVSIIRAFKPDVIICRFPSTGEGGHGHHTASAILAIEAFEAAADPSRFPEHLTTSGPWKAKRILWNTFNFGTTNTTSPDQLKIDVGGYNALIGKSYGEISAESRSMHKSQGFGSAKSRGSQIEYFKHLKGDEAKTDLFENIDISWNRIPGTEAFSKHLSSIINNFNIQHPEQSVDQLITLLDLLDKIKPVNDEAIYWKSKKKDEITQAIMHCAGLWFEAYASSPTLSPLAQADFNTSIVLRNQANITLDKITWFDSDTLTALTLIQNNLYTFKHKKSVPEKLPFTNPYWLKESHHPPGSFIIKDRSMLGAPESNPALTTSFEFTVNNRKLTYAKPVVYKSTDPVKGEVYRPLEILPPATVNLGEKSFVFSGKIKKTIQAVIRSNKEKVSGILSFNIPEGWTSTQKEFQFSLEAKGDEKVISITLEPTGNKDAGVLKAKLLIDGKTYPYSITRIDYDHIPMQVILTPSEAKLVNVELNRNGSNIGYIQGAGDDVPQALRQVGYTVNMITDEQLANSDLSIYDAIVTGVRAYNTNDRLQVHYKRLMNYVENGGNLIVQYNTNNRIGPIIAKISPYPLNITRERVTDENAEVTFNLPNHPALNSPNKITKEDFNGWIQERGIYFANDISKEYETPLSLNDPGEKPNPGSLLIAKHGKGNFVYTGLVFFRELPAGVPGAYRLFANLLSLPDNK